MGESATPERLGDYTATNQRLYSDSKTLVHTNLLYKIYVQNVCGHEDRTVGEDGYQPVSQVSLCKNVTKLSSLRAKYYESMSRSGVVTHRLPVTSQDSFDMSPAIGNIEYLWYITINNSLILVCKYVIQ